MNLTKKKKEFLEQYNEKKKSTRKHVTRNEHDVINQSQPNETNANNLFHEVVGWSGLAPPAS